MAANDKEFANKVVLVTGSSAGIGEGIAVLFATMGAKVVVTGRNEKNIAEVVDKCNKASPNGSKALGVTADISKEADVRQIVEKTIKEFKQIDVLVNNAGVGGLATIDDPKILEIFDTLMNVNVRSIVLLSHLVVPHLKKTKGNIINISSVAATVPYPKMSAYAATKAAVDVITKNLALELGPMGIRVNGINPGIIKTNFVTRMGIPEEHKDAAYDTMKQLSPIGLIGYPKDIADMTLFLASKKAAFITGSNFVVDGGYSIMNKSLEGREEIKL